MNCSKFIISSLSQKNSLLQINCISVRTKKKYNIFFSTDEKYYIMELVHSEFDKTKYLYPHFENNNGQ